MKVILYVFFIITAIPFVKLTMVEFLVKVFGLLFACSKMRGIHKAAEKQCINKQLLGCSDKTQRMAHTSPRLVTQIPITWNVQRHVKHFLG